MPLPSLLQDCSIASPLCQGKFSTTFRGRPAWRCARHPGPPSGCFSPCHTAPCAALRLLVSKIHVKHSIYRLYISIDMLICESFLCLYLPESLLRKTSLQETSIARCKQAQIKMPSQVLFCVVVHRVENFSRESHNLPFSHVPFVLLAAKELMTRKIATRNT